MVLSAWAGNDACASRRVINTADGALELFRYQDRLNQFDFDMGASRDFCAVEAFLPMRD